MSNGPVGLASVSLPYFKPSEAGYESVYSGINNMRHTVRKMKPRFTKSSSLVIIGPILNEIKPFKTSKMY